MKYLVHLSKATILPILFFLVSSCGKTNKADFPTTAPRTVSDVDLKSLPNDQGGVQTAVYLNNNLLFGYYVYTPSGYATNQANYPLLVFLHGAGEEGNSHIDPNSLKRVLAHGPPELINKKQWSPVYPLIVVSPQETASRFDPDSLQDFIKYIVTNYRINIHRIYLTGLSMGGISAYNYLSKYARTGYVAAAVPLSVRFDVNRYPKPSDIVNFPLWTFIGSVDIGVNDCINIANSINQLKPTLKAKLTIFPGIGHDCWDPVYSGSAMGTEDKNYDAFNMSIYDWMFQYAK